MANLATAITALIESKKYSTLRDILVTMNAADIAALFDDLEPELLPRLFRLLPKELAAETFVEMESDSQETLIRGFFCSFKSNFRQSTQLWCVCVGVLLVLAGDLLVRRYLPQWSTLLTAAALIQVILLLTVMLYAFPLQARFEIGRAHV